MAIPAPPATPSRNRPTAFSAEMDAYLAWFSAAVPEINVIATGSVDTGVYNTITLNSYLIMDQGTAALPSITFDGDLNTGFHSPGANQIAASTNGVTRFTLTDTAATFEGNISAANLTGGGYTPTLTNVTNVAASSAATTQWFRVGDWITVFGIVNITATAANTDTTLRMSLPVASDFVNAHQAGGSGGSISAGTFGAGAAIAGDIATNTAVFRLRPTVTTSQSFHFNFSYLVV